MGLREEVSALLRQGHEKALADLVASDRRALRPLMGRLWDPDADVRARAAGAIGLAAEHHTALGIEIIRRLMWALNDESATNGVYGIPALGAIGRRNPRLFEPFVGPLASMAWDDGLRLELMGALAAVAEADPSLVAPHMERLAQYVDGSNPEETGAMNRLAGLARGGTTHDG